MISYAGEDYEENQNQLISDLIEDAVEEIRNVMYPNGLSIDKISIVDDYILENYRGKVKKIAQYHYDKQGKEGVKSTTENMTTFTYENSGTPSSYLRGIIPYSMIC